MKHIACSKMEFVHCITHFGHYALHICYLTLVFSTSHAGYGLVAGLLGIATVATSIIDWKTKRRAILLHHLHKD